jgi:hypothetical protein
MRCFEKGMDSVNKETVPLDGNVWKGDNIEIMVLPGYDHHREYFQLALNPAGSLFDAKTNDKAWNSNAKAFSYSDNESWTVVVSIPFASIKDDMKDVPSLWRLNLHRFRPKRSGNNPLDLAWSPTISRSNHVPARFGLGRLKGVGRPINAEEISGFLKKAKKVEKVYFQDFEKDRAGIREEVKVLTREGPGGTVTFLRAEKLRKITLDRHFANIRGLNMAIKYRTAPHQHGLVIHGSGTEVRAGRPGAVHVYGRGLEMAKKTCRDADRASKAVSYGLDAFYFLRPYGH